MSPRPLPLSFKSRARHFRLFWIAILVSFAVGFPLRSWLAHPHVRGLIREQIERGLPPGDQFTTEQIAISLANGWLPEFAIRLDRVYYKRAGCGALAANARRVTLPLSLSEFLKGHLAVGRVRVEQAQMRLPTKCAPELPTKEPLTEVTAAPSVPDSSPALAKTGEVVDTPERPVQAALLHLREGLVRLQQFRALKGVKIDHLEIFVPEQEQPWTVRRVSLTGLSGTSALTYEGILQFPNWPGWSERLPQINFWGEGQSEQLSLEMRGHWKEGTLSLVAHLSGASGFEELDIRTSLQHLPLFQVGEVVERLSRTRREMRPRLAWLSCEGVLRTKLSELGHARVVVAPCQVEGALGRIAIPDVQVGWNKGLQVENLKARFEQVSIDALLEVAQISPPTRGVMARLGLLNGELEMTPAGIAYRGEINGLELLFSNLGRRALQHVARLKADLQLQNGRLKGRFSDVLFRDGEASGAATFDISDDLAQGNFQIKFDPVHFAPDVEQVLLSGRADGLKVMGEGNLAQHKLVSWNGTIQLEQLLRDDLIAKGIRVRAGLKSEKTSASLEIKSVQLDSRTGTTRWLEPLFAQLGEASQYELARVRAELGIADRIFSWRGLQASVASKPRWTVVSNGGWNDAEEVRGWIQLGNAGQSQRWAVRGDRGEPALEKTQLSLVELAQQELPPKTERVVSGSPVEPLSTQLLGQIRSWLPRFGRTPSAASPTHGANP